MLPPWRAADDPFALVKHFYQLLVCIIIDL